MRFVLLMTRLMSTICALVSTEAPAGAEGPRRQL
jgi:hypothetical protein